MTARQLDRATIPIQISTVKKTGALEIATMVNTADPIRKIRKYAKTSMDKDMEEEMRSREIKMQTQH